MRILHVVPTYLPAIRYGGPIRSIHGLCRSLAKLGHDVHVFTTNVDGPYDSPVPLQEPVLLDEVKVWYFPTKYSRYLYVSPMMRDTLKKEITRFDLLHLHSIFRWPTWMAARVARGKSIPYILSPRGMLVKSLIQRKNPFLKTLWIQLVEKGNIERAAGIHFTSPLEETEAKRFHFSWPPAAVIPNGLDVQESQPGNGNISPQIKSLLDRKPMLLFIGRVNWKKGLDRLILSLPAIPKAHLVIAGNDEEGYQKVLENLARKAGVSQRVSYAGYVDGTEKIALLKSADLFVLPSYSENFGNSVLEAMAVGCPVVVAADVGLSDTVQESGAGRVINGDPKQMAEDINHLLAHRELRNEMGARGKEVVRSQFDGQKVGNDMLATYQQCLDSAGKRNP